MIRKNAVTLVLTVLVALSMLLSMQALRMANHDPVDAGNRPNVILVSGEPTPTPSNSNPSGGGNGGG